MPSELRSLSLPPELLVPLTPGHDPSPRSVAAGTVVRPGESLLRDPHRTGFYPTPRAPVAATVLGERPAKLTSGQSVTAIVLQPTPFQHDTAPRITSKPFSEQILELLTAPPDRRALWPATLAAANLAISRPTSPDLFAQLADPTPVDTILVTALDPDAHLGVAAGVADESSPDVIAGAVLLARYKSAKTLLIALEPTVHDRAKRELTRLAAEAARLAATTGFPLTTRVVTFANHYPRAESSLLISRLLGRKLSPASLPTARGVVLVDTPAAAAVGRVARHDQPLTHIPLGLFDHRHRKTYLLRTPVGTPVLHLFAALEIPSSTPFELRTGDVLQERISPRTAVLSPSDLYLHILTPPAPTPPDPCIRCGWCVEACPTRVNPAAVLEAAQLNLPHLATSAGVSACIECGLCQYVCPSRLPLLAALRSFIRKGEG